MNIDVHNQILWYGCLKALQDHPNIKDPRPYFPLMVRGSWMNDTNQATIVTGQIKRTQVQQDIQQFFCAYWNEDKARLLKQMRRIRGVSNSLVQEANGHLETIPGDRTDDFGLYDRLDHLDILDPKTAVQEQRRSKQDSLWRGETIIKAMKSVRLRIGRAWSEGEDDRFKWDRVSNLGRALHVLQDVYAHSNFVELLLWSLAWRCELDDSLLHEFNRPLSYFKKPPFEQCFCPLPLEGQVDKMTALNIMFWYGKNPAQTPFVSTLFDTSDTAVSLLDMYAANLVKLDEKGHDPRIQSIALSVFQVPGAPLVKWIWNGANWIHDRLEEIGDAARDFLANVLENRMEKLDNVSKKTAEVGIKLLREYSSSEAKDWARAGKMNYLSYSLKRAMAKELFKKNRTGFSLPHHSLLRKDYYPHRFDEIICFRLACIFATELTAEMIAWYFSDRPQKNEITPIINSKVFHPWKYFDVSNDNSICSMLEKKTRSAASQSWTRNFDNN